MKRSLSECLVAGKTPGAGPRKSFWSPCRQGFKSSSSVLSHHRRRKKKKKKDPGKKHRSGDASIPRPCHQEQRVLLGGAGAGARLPGGVEGDGGMWGSSARKRGDWGKGRESNCSDRHRHFQAPLHNKRKYLFIPWEVMLWTPHLLFFCSVFCCFLDLNQLQEGLSEPNIPARAEPGRRQPGGGGADGRHGQDLSILQKPAECWGYLRGEGTLSRPYGHFWARI